MTEANGRLAADAESICVGCGLCCDGTLHGTARVRKNDEAAVAAVGLEVATLKGKRVFHQPCPHFSAGQCGVYADRPMICRTYRCALLESVDEGRVSRADALQRIATAKRLVSIVRAIDADVSTPARRVELTQRLKAELPLSDEPRRRKISRTLLDLGVLDHFLLRWFLKKKTDDRTARNART